MTDALTPDRMPEVPTQTAALPGGGQMPLLGFGTWQLTGDVAATATAAALAAGYRHLDTAHVYRNHREVGAALREHGRDGIFLTTKIPPQDAPHARQRLETTLDELGVDALDLWLIHWPAGDRADVDLWRHLVAAREEGLTRDVGVSNYDLAQLDELADTSGVMPAVNQIRWSPYLHDPDVLAGHEERGVVLEGYSGLKGGVLTDPVVTGLAERLGRTPAQVLLRWHLEHGIVAIPRSQQPARVRENADLAGFTLTAEDVAALDALAR